MLILICPRVTDLDEKTCEILNEGDVGAWTPERVANYRGILYLMHSEITDYDENTLAVAIINDINNIQREKELSQLKDLQKILNKNADVTLIGDFYKKALSQLGAKLLSKRVNLVSSLFSKLVTGVLRKNLNLDRSDICNGFTVNGQVKYGLSAIFAKIYKDFLKNAKDLEAKIKEGGTEDLLLIWRELLALTELLLDNYAIITALARLQLRTTEKLVLSNFDSTVLEATDWSDTDTWEEYVQEESTKESYQEHKEKKSAFGSLTPIIRLIFSTIPETTDNGEILKDDLGFTVYRDPIKVHQTVVQVVLGARRFKDMLKLLQYKSLEYGYGWLNYVVNAITENKERQTQFTVNMHKGKLFYSILIEEFKEFKTKILNILNSSSFKLYLSKLKITSADNLKGTNIDTYSNQEKATQFNKIINSISNKSTTVTERTVFLSNLFNFFKIDYTSELLLAIATSNAWANIRKKITTSKDFIEKFIKSNSEFQLKDLLFIKEEGNKNYNILREFLSKTLFTAIDEVSALAYERRVGYTNSKNQSSSYDSIVESSFMTDIFGDIELFVKTNDCQGLIEYLKNRYLCSSYFYEKEVTIKSDANTTATFIEALPTTIDPNRILNEWIRDLYLSAVDENGNVKTSFDSNSFAAKLSFNRLLGNSEHIEFENFTTKQHLTAMILFWRSSSDTAPKENKNYAQYPTFILGDSNITKFITAKMYGNKEKGMSTEDEQHILDQLYNVYKSELLRKKLWEDAAKSCNNKLINIAKSFLTKKFLFTLLPFLNEEKYRIPEEQQNVKDIVQQKIKDYLDDRVKTLKEDFDKLGLLETETDKSGKHYYKMLGTKVTSDNIDTFIKSYYWNNKLQMINQLQFFIIDPAYYDNSKDLQKRYKEIHASGVALDIDALEDAESQIERVIYFEDIGFSVERDNDFSNALAYQFGLLSFSSLEISNLSKEDIIERGKQTLLYKKYLNNSATDGQGYRSLESYRKVSKMAGTWTYQHEKAYSRILELRNKGNNITALDIGEISRLSVVFLPIKPFMFTHESYKINEGNTLLVGVQVKYSETVLIPELLPKGYLKDVATYMTENKIDVLASTKCIKTGMFGLADILYETNENHEYIDAEGNVIEDGMKNPLFLLKAVKIQSSLSIQKAMQKAYVHEFNYQDYRILTNVPLHMNEELLFGTLLRKLIFSRLSLSNNYSHYILGNKVLLDDGNLVNLTGRNLLAFYNSLIMANIFETFEKLSKTITDSKKLSKILMQNVLSNSREALDNILAYSITNDDNFLLPLFEGMLAHDSAASLFSIFKKAVNKLKMKGGSAVQAAALGLSGYEADGDLHYITDPNDDTNIIYAECEMPFNFSYTSYDGKQINLKFEDYCHADGTLILDESEEIDITKSENKIFSSYYIVDENNNKHYYKPLIEKDYPEILSILAYRIPTERAYSMLNLRIKRFSPLISGGTIKVPVEGTTIAGFDFDIKQYWCH